MVGDRACWKLPYLNKSVPCIHQTAYGRSRDGGLLYRGTSLVKFGMFWPPTIPNIAVIDTQSIRNCILWVLMNRRNAYASLNAHSRQFSTSVQLRWPIFWMTKPIFRMRSQRHLSVTNWLQKLSGSLSGIDLSAVAVKIPQTLIIHNFFRVFVHNELLAQYTFLSFSAIRAYCFAWMISILLYKWRYLSVQFTP